MAIEYYDSLNIDSNDDSYFLGSVGIGTTAPGAKLQIGSATYSPSGNLANNFLQIKSSSGFAYLTIGNGDVANSTAYIAGASGLITLGSVTDAGVTSEYIRMGNTGNVGIGTTSPSYKLEVDGTSRITGRLTLGGNVNNFVEGLASSVDFKSNGHFNFTKGSNNLLTVLETGNVGIGTTSPSEKLTVSGGANVTGKFAVGISATHASFDLYNDGTSYLNGAVTVDDTLDLVNLKVSGAQGTDGQVLTSTGSGVAWEDVSGGSSPWTTDTNGITYTAGNVGIGAASEASTDLRVGGFARFNGDVRFDGDVQCAGGDLIVNNSLKDVNSATGTSGQILSSEGAGGGVEWIDAGVKSSTSGEPSGSDSVINIVSLTQAEYDAGTPLATTLYIIT